MNRRTQSIEFTKDDFQQHNPEEEVLFATLFINGVGFHVCAIAVDEDEESGQFAVQDPYGRLEDAMKVDAEGAYETVEIEGLAWRYVIIITPFKD